jgi:ribokinase
VEAAEEAARRAHEAGVALAVVTLGKAGAVLCDATGTARIPAFEVTAVDTTAAGDAFVGALAVALGAGTPAREAVRLANAAGAAAATRAGAQSSLPRAADLERLFGLRWPIRRTVV